MTGHTRGPWTLRQAMKWGPGSTRDRVNWIDDPGRFDVNGPDGDMPSIAEDVWEPDARLIAQAPEQQAKIDALGDALVELYRFMLRDDVQALAPDPLYRAQALSALRAIGRIP